MSVVFHASFPINVIYVILGSFFVIFYKLVKTFKNAFGWVFQRYFIIAFSQKYVTLLWTVHWMFIRKAPRQYLYNMDTMDGLSDKTYWLNCLHLLHDVPRVLQAQDYNLSHFTLSTNFIHPRIILELTWSPLEVWINQKLIFNKIQSQIESLSQIRCFTLEAYTLPYSIPLHL